MNYDNKKRYNLVRLLFLEKNWTRTRAAKELDCSPQHLSQIIHGRRSGEVPYFIGRNLLDKFCKKLNVSVEEFNIDISPALQIKLDNILSETRKK